MRPSRLMALGTLLVATSGCALVQPVSPSIPVTRETTAQCVTHCEELGLELGAVVLVHNSAGCVCQPVRAASSSTATGGAALAAAAAILDDEQADAKRAEEHRHSPGTPGTPGAPGAHSTPGMPTHH